MEVATITTKDRGRCTPYSRLSQRLVDLAPVPVGRRAGPKGGKAHPEDTFNPAT